MKYNDMTNEELILELQKKDNEIKKLNQKLKKENESKVSTSPITFEIINFNEDDSWLRIELLWKNNSSKNIHFIQGTLKFYDDNDNLVCVDDNHICDELNAFCEKAYVVQYLKRRSTIPSNATKVEVSISNIY